ncbi:MAG: winged helix-turn-helix transcriptional regulator [Candidatus Nanohaloarchaeota archaeon]|nr:winged helix-turn-helix transcriptional regulator [Candidatus Nanohaloarchaeota archaeon]
MDEKKKAVIEAMKKAGKEVKTGDVAKILGWDSKEVSKIIKQLQKEGIVYSPKRCYYAVKS